MLDTNQLATKAKNAKNILLVFFALYLILDIIIIFYKSKVMGVEIESLIRLVLTILLMWCVLRGYKWAKWLTIVLWFLGSLLCFGLGFSIIHESLHFTIIFFLMGAFFLTLPIYLLASKNIKIYFNYKRQNDGEMTLS